MKNKRIPEVRFSEFTVEWEQYKLEYFIEDYVEKTEIQNQYPVLTSSQKHGIILQEDYFADRQVTTQNNVGYFVLPRGYFTYRSRSDNGIFKFNRNDIINRGIISYFYPVFKIVNGDSDFFLRLLNSVTKKQVMLESEGTGQKVLSLRKFKNIKVQVSSIEEQSKIGEFFKQLDDTIALHYRELDNLKQTKQGFLQKMFPKEGEKVPELRFPGFTDEWKQRKLGDNAIIKGRLGWKSLKQEEYTVEGPAMIAGRHINDGIIDWTMVDHIPQWRYDESPEIMLKNYDVIFSKDGSLGNPALINNLEGLATINSTMMLVRTDETIDSSFFYQVMKSDQFKQLVYLKVSGSSIPHLFQADMNEFKFMAPEVSEQKAIADFLKNLDTTITLHQQELNLLKETQKALLQKMFI